MNRWILLACILVGATGCVEVVQATDCREAAPPCGIVVVDARTHAMTSVPVTVPVSAIP